MMDLASPQLRPPPPSPAASTQRIVPPRPTRKTVPSPAEMVHIDLGPSGSREKTSPLPPAMPAPVHTVSAKPKRAPDAAGYTALQRIPTAYRRQTLETDVPSTDPNVQAPMSVAARARGYFGAMFQSATKVTSGLLARANEALAFSDEEYERLAVAGQYFSLDTKALHLLDQDDVSSRICDAQGSSMPKGVPTITVSPPEMPSDYRAQAPRITKHQDHDRARIEQHKRISAQYRIAPHAQRILRGHTARVNSACFSPDGRHLLTASSDHTARLYDLHAPSDSFVELRGHKAHIYFACFSPCGHYVVTCSGDHTAKLWRTKQSALVSIDLQDHKDAVFFAHFSADSRSLVTTSFDGSASIWDLTHTKPQVTLRLVHPGVVTSAYFSPDARSIVTVALKDPKSPRLYRLTQPQPPLPRQLRGGLQPTPVLSHRLIDRERASRFACFSPNGQLLATTSNNRVIIRSVHTPADVMMVLDGHVEAVNALAFSPDGRFVATVSQDCMGRLWDLRKGGAASVLFAKHEDNIRTAAFSPDGRYIVTASWDKTAKIYDFDPYGPC